MRLSRSLIGSRSSKAVYGIILITVVLIGFDKHLADPLDIALKVVLAAIVIVLAEIYSDYLGEKIKLRKVLNKKERRDIAYDASAIFTVSLYPAIVFLISAMGLYSTETAFKITYFLSLAGLGSFGYIASVYAGDTKYVSLKRSAIAVLVGLVVILLKYELGH